MENTTWNTKKITLKTHRSTEIWDRPEHEIEDYYKEKIEYFLDILCKKDKLSEWFNIFIYYKNLQKDLSLNVNLQIQDDEKK